MNNISEKLQAIKKHFQQVDKREYVAKLETKYGVLIEPEFEKGTQIFLGRLPIIIGTGIASAAPCYLVETRTQRTKKRENPKALHLQASAH